MSLAASRQVLRRSTFAVRRAGIRNASSTSEAAGAAKEKASAISSKASEGLTRVTSSASAAASKVGSAATNAASKVGGRTGRLINGVQGQYANPGSSLGQKATLDMKTPFLHAQEPWRCSMARTGALMVLLRPCRWRVAARSSECC